MASSSDDPKAVSIDNYCGDKTTSMPESGQNMYTFCVLVEQLFNVGWVSLLDRSRRKFVPGVPPREITIELKRMTETKKLPIVKVVVHGSVHIPTLTREHCLGNRVTSTKHERVVSSVQGK